MPKAKKPKSKPQQLLVEGNSDKQVIEALCTQNQISKNSFEFAFPEQGGIENLIKTLPIKLKEENLITLGIVVDADENVAARWQAVTNKLQNSGYQNIPKIPPENGWIDTQPELPKIGIWLMPDNKLPGMLENFVTYLIPSEDKLKYKAEAILKEIEAENLNPYSLTHHQKVLIHTWLAWQKKPGMPMGQAITAQILSHNSAITSCFTTWLKNLFGN